MRITGNKPISGVQSKAAQKGKSSSSEAFVPDTGAESVAAAQVAGGSAIQGMDALLALQEVDGVSERRSRAAKHGHSLLDLLEKVRADLLAGHVSEEQLDVLSQRVANRQESGDERIDSVLDEIELRVKVELAKLGRFSD